MLCVADFDTEHLEHLFCLCHQMGGIQADPFRGTVLEFVLDALNIEDDGETTYAKMNPERAEFYKRMVKRINIGKQYLYPFCLK